MNFSDNQIAREPIRSELIVTWQIGHELHVVTDSSGTAHTVVRYGTHSCQVRHTTDVKYNTHSCHVRSYVNDRSRAKRVRPCHVQGCVSWNSIERKIHMCLPARRPSDSSLKFTQTFLSQTCHNYFIERTTKYTLLYFQKATHWKLWNSLLPSFWSLRLWMHKHWEHYVKARTPLQ